MAATQRLGLGVLRHSTWDALFVWLSFAHAAVLFTVPSVPVIAIGLWWNANTISHNFIHLPFFRAAPLNRAYSAYLTLLLGIPHNIWRQRHLRHHAGLPETVRWTREAAFDVALVLALWLTLAIAAPGFFFGTYVPGFLAGLFLCFLQGHFEHARGTTSHYGRLYNLSFFNDGYHVEHHQHPAEHWTRLPHTAGPAARVSGWPPVLRWIDHVSLEGLERLVTRSPVLQGFVVEAHRRAIARLLPRLGAVTHVRIVGGGLFPRTALVVRALWPAARITIVDRDAEHLDMARAWVDGRVEFVHETCSADTRHDADVVVIPLAFDGDRAAIYANPPARFVLVHDWIWARRGDGVVVSWWLLKRLNLVTR